MGAHLSDDTKDEADHLRDQVDQHQGHRKDEPLDGLGLKADHVVDDDCEDDGYDCLEWDANQRLGQEKGRQPVLTRLDLLGHLH